ncbi:MAG: RluA family pseudouridine synthase [Candidatus Brocadiia bacterium]
MNKPYTMVFEDDQIMVVDKSAGLLVIPTPAGETHTLTDLLNRELTAKGQTSRAHPCHRLDRETSGLILYAKGKATQQSLMEQFHKHLVKKKYICFAQGYIKTGPNNWMTIDSPLEGKHALTRYRVTKLDLRGFSIVEVEPETGLTNQIRLHFKAIRHPLVGERRFSYAKDYALKFRRVALHATYLSFQHPVTKEQLEFTSPLPPDMAEF